MDLTVVCFCRLEEYFVFVGCRYIWPRGSADLIGGTRFMSHVVLISVEQVQHSSRFSEMGFNSAVVMKSATSDGQTVDSLLCAVMVTLRVIWDLRCAWCVVCRITFCMDLMWKRESRWMFVAPGNANIPTCSWGWCKSLWIHPRAFLQWRMSLSSNGGDFLVCGPALWSLLQSISFGRWSYCCSRLLMHSCCPLGKQHHP